MNKIPYGRQNIDQNDIDAVVLTLQSDYLTQGPKVKEFEVKFAEYVGANYAVAVNNATSGLHLSVLALNLKNGDRVITTPITFAASATAMLSALCVPAIIISRYKSSIASEIIGFEPEVIFFISVNLR